MIYHFDASVNETNEDSNIRIYVCNLSRDKALAWGATVFFFCPYEMHKEVGARPLKIAVGSKLMIYTTCFYTIYIFLTVYFRYDLWNLTLFPSDSAL